MNLPEIADRFKRSIISETAIRLAATHGRRKMHSSDEVRAALKAAQFPEAWSGWAVAVFCTDNEFAAFCAAQGLTADYRATRADVLRYIDKPPPAVPAPVQAGTAALGMAAGAAAAAGSQSAAGSVLETAGTLLDVADTTLDVVGTVFEVLDIFS